MPLDYVPSVCCTVQGVFPLRGTHLPAHHGPALYAALCALPDLGRWLAEANDVAIAPVAGRTRPDGLLTLTADSRLLLRLPAAELPRILGLAGRRLDVGGCQLDLAEPRVEVPRPAATLSAELVVLDHQGVPGAHRKGGGDTTADTAADAFLAAVRSQLAALEIPSRISVGPARSLALADRSAQGFAVTIGDLAPDDSIHLLEAGLGDHRKLGCGVFLPA
jgi:hypothetical protein